MDPLLRMLLQRFRLWRVEQRLTNARTMTDLRWVYRELGVSLDGLTDQEISVGAVELLEGFSAIGISAAEAGRRFKELALAAPQREEADGALPHYLEE